MTRGGAGNMLGVGGTRQHLGRKALRGGGRGSRIGGGGADPRAQKRELLRTLQEKRQAQSVREAEQAEQAEQGEGNDGREGRGTPLG